jgi:hypothetical protein
VRDKPSQGSYQDFFSAKAKHRTNGQISVQRSLFLMAPAQYMGSMLTALFDAFNGYLSSCRQMIPYHEFS